MTETPSEWSGQEPVVTVLMAVYNGETFVESAIESVLDQTFSEFEFLVVDDGSTDDTPEILDGIDDPRLRVVRQENQGQAAALNHGLRQARGEYIARIDDDDIAYQERLERQVAVLEGDKRIGVVGSWHERTNTEGGTEETWTRRPPVTDDAIRREFPIRNPIAHSTATFQRDAAQTVGGYDETIDSCIDYDLWVRIGAAGYRFANVDEVVCRIIQHDESSYRFNGWDQIKHYLRSLRIGWRAARTLGVPVRYHLWPAIMFLWAILPSPMKTLVRRVRPTC